MFQVVHRIILAKSQTNKFYSAPNFPNNNNGSANTIQLQTNKQ